MTPLKALQHKAYSNSWLLFCLIRQIAAFQDGDSILLRVVCKKDATTHLDDAIPYGLAVTLEVAEETGIQIYESIQNQLQVRI